MKQENLGKKIAAAVILIIIALGVIIMLYINGVNKNKDMQNETNLTTNEVVDKETPQEAPVMGPNDTTQAGVIEEVN